MSTRDDILAKIKVGKPTSIAYPLLPEYPFTGEKLTGFKEQLTAFDGRWAEIESIDQVGEYIATHFPDAKHILSNIPTYKGTMDISAIKKPTDAAAIDLTVIEGSFGVGESGSVWVTDRELKINAVGLLALNLLIVLDKQKIVGNLHDAYRLIRNDIPDYGSFYSGPSATADIEAIHITGAQGVLSLTVLLVEK